MDQFSLLKHSHEQLTRETHSTSSETHSTRFITTLTSPGWTCFGTRLNMFVSFPKTSTHENQAPLLKDPELISSIFCVHLLGLLELWLLAPKLKLRPLNHRCHLLCPPPTTTLWHHLLDTTSSASSDCESAGSETGAASFSTTGATSTGVAKSSSEACASSEQQVPPLPEQTPPSPQLQGLHLLSGYHLLSNMGLLRWSSCLLDDPGCDKWSLIGKGRSSSSLMQAPTRLWTMKFVDPNWLSSS